jgi:hypothetical protein
MRLSARDAAVTALVLVLSSGLIGLYLQERDRVSVKSGEAALGTIVFKKLNATRRFQNGLRWERIRNNSPIYQADTLRTTELSEASVCFDDGTKLDMYENSMLRLEFVGRERTLQFLAGDISVSGGAAVANADLSGLEAPKGAEGGSYKIAVGGKTLALSDASRASLSRSGNTLSVEVATGEVGMTDAEGRSETIGRMQGLEIDLAAGTSKIVERPIIALYPEQNARLLREGSGKTEIGFSWEIDEDAPATLEIASDREFSTPVISTQAARKTLSVAMDPGSWYWRLRSARGAETAPRRFNLSVEEPPAPILPVSGTELYFRKLLPELRFSWTRMAAAAAYIFEISPDPQFVKLQRRDRVSLESITVGSLPEGTWYWRVTPLYAMELVGEKSASEVRSFSIRRRPEMTSLVSTMPAPDSMFVVQEAAAKGLSFSWQPDQEAVEYELRIGGSRNMEAAVIKQLSNKPWMTLSGSEVAALESPGTWNWALRWRDEEGNWSPYSPPRRLQGVDGRLAIKLTFPPEGYTIADSLVGSTRFAWKTNLKAKAVFQLSEDPVFSTIDWESEAESGTLIGKPCKSGNWYWRIKSLNPDGTVFHQTEPRRFRVVDPLPGPGLVAPLRGGIVYLRSEDGFTFRWDEIPGADYYQFSLHDQSKRGAEVQGHTALLPGTSIELPLGGFAPGRYRVLLQAFGLDKESSTRLIGYIGSSDFSYLRLERLGLALPADGTRIEGLDARRRGVALAWTVPERPESAELLIALDRELHMIVARKPGISGTALVERLPAGSYFWTVKAALKGLDISAAAPSAFTILPIPLLPSPTRLLPPSGFSFGPAELRNLDRLRFEWDEVTSATSYEVALFRGADPLPLARWDSVAEPFCELADFSLLENAEYRWTVRARAFDKTGELEQDGLPADSRFAIDIPPLVPPEPKAKETFYGR